MGNAGVGSPVQDPLGAVERKPLHFIWLVDCSGSMASPAEKIQSLNAAIHEVLPVTRDALKKNPFVQMLMRAIKFSTGATWHVATPTPIENFDWTDLGADGVTDMGAAFRLLATELVPDKIGKHALTPVLVLMTDGGPTDDWEAALKELNQTPWGKSGRTVRIAIAIGQDGVQNRGVLEKFTGNPETVFDALNSTQLAQLIHYASVTVSVHLASGKSKTDPTTGAVQDIPTDPGLTATGNRPDDKPW